MKQYLELLKDILENGHRHEDRTGVGRISVFGRELRFKMSDGFPLPGASAVYYKGMIKETLWFIGGNDNANLLSDQGVKIWDKWKVTRDVIRQFMKSRYSIDDSTEMGKKALESLTEASAEFMDGTIGPMYGKIWRNAPRSIVSEFDTLPDFSELPSDKIELYKSEWERATERRKTDEKLANLSFEEYAVRRYITTVDQFQTLINNIKSNPYSSRLCMTAWIPEYIPSDKTVPEHNPFSYKGVLAPCHLFVQCFVTPPKTEGGRKRLSLKMTMRSSDVPVGTPYNISQYALILAMIAQCCDMDCEDLIISFGDAHIYFDQEEKVREHIIRTPPPLPKLWLNPEIKDIYKFTFDDIRIDGYDPLSAMGYPVAK